MAMSIEDTFHYVAVIPDRAGTEFTCATEGVERPESNWAGDFDRRLVGYKPLLEVRDGGATPDPGTLNPATQRSRITLIATDKNSSLVERISFFLDSGLITALRAGDTLQIARSFHGRIGVSAIRGDELIFAVGAVCAVSLGKGLQIHTPLDLVNEAESVFRKRYPEFRLSEHPIEIIVGNERWIGYRCNRRFGLLQIFSLHGYRTALLTGTDECVSIARIGACQSVDANVSAFFLDTDTPEIGKRRVREGR
jgi:hypothetical protein